MTAPKFTAVDWFPAFSKSILVDGSSVSVAYIYPSGNFRGDIARLQDCENIKGIGRDEMIANAYLIAAAPDMYSRHEEDIRILGYLLNELTGRVEAGKLAALEKMRDSKVALLAKARGEQ